MHLYWGYITYLFFLAVGKISRRVSFVHYPDPTELEKLIPSNLKLLYQRPAGTSVTNTSHQFSTPTLSTKLKGSRSSSKYAASSHGSHHGGASLEAGEASRGKRASEPSLPAGHYSHDSVHVCSGVSSEHSRGYSSAGTSGSMGNSHQKSPKKKRKKSEEWSNSKNEIQSHPCYRQKAWRQSLVVCELLMLPLHCAGRVLTGVSMIVCFALGFHFLLFEYFSTAPCICIFSCTVLDREEPKISWAIIVIPICHWVTCPPLSSDVQTTSHSHQARIWVCIRDPVSIGKYLLVIFGGKKNLLVIFRGSVHLIPTFLHP